MSASAAVQRVVDRLDGAGYVPLDQPVSIGGIPFDFSAMLAGRDSLDLVVIADTVADLTTIACVDVSRASPAR